MGIHSVFLITLMVSSVWIASSMGQLTGTTTDEPATETSSMGPLTGSTTKKPVSTTKKPGFQCPTSGRFSDLSDTTGASYYLCSWTGSDFQMWKLKCPGKLVFFQPSSRCVRPK